MELEPNLESFDLVFLNSSILEEIIFKAIQTLITRTRESENKAEALSILMSIKASIFAFECEYFGYSLDPKDYTPRRANDLMTYEINQEKESCLTPRREMLNYVINSFWTSCFCARNCFTKVSIASALQTCENFIVHWTLKKKAKA